MLSVSSIHYTPTRIFIRYRLYQEGPSDKKTDALYAPRIFNLKHPALSLPARFSMSGYGMFNFDSIREIPSESACVAFFQLHQR